MLVHRDGLLVCELSGGCPQRDIVLRAHRAMESGEPARVSYGRNDNYDVMIETGCGGELEVLIEPWCRPEDIQFLDAIEALRARRVPGVMASLFATGGHPLSPRPLRLVHGDKTVWTNIDDAALQERVLASMASQSPTASVAVATGLEHAGQRYDVLLESLHPPHALVIVGDSVGAHMLASLSFQLGWHTTLVGTGEPASPAPAGVRQLAALPHALASAVSFDHQTSAVVMTHRLERDLAYATSLMGTPVRYIGVMGSRQRSGQIRAIFPEDNRLHAPAGLDVGSETPQEIALAIAAEILALRNGRSGGPLAYSLAPIHP
jgi:xanthine/CO dehydrogenase XdhC/CoxF family maturation factor